MCKVIFYCQLLILNCIPGNYLLRESYNGQQQVDTVRVWSYIGQEVNLITNPPWDMLYKLTAYLTLQWITGRLPADLSPATQMNTGENSVN